MTFDGTSVITFNTLGVDLESSDQFQARVVLSDSITESYYELNITFIEPEVEENNPPYFQAFSSEFAITKYLETESYEIPDPSDFDGDSVNVAIDISCCTEWI